MGTPKGQSRFVGICEESPCAEDESAVYTEVPESFCPRMLYHWKVTGKRFVVLLEKLFEFVSWKITKRPLLVIALTLLFTLLCTGGFAKISVETSVKHLFVPEDNQALRDLKRAARYGYKLELRQEEVIFLPKTNKSILSTECMEEVLDLHQEIVAIDKYDQLCYKPFEPVTTCASLNVLEAFGYRRWNLGDPTSRIEKLMADERFLMGNARTLRDNYYGLFGGQTRNKSLDDVAALRMVYYMTEYDKEDPRRDEILAWEKIFLEKLSTFAENKTCVGEVVYSAERSLDDSVGESTGSDISFFAVTFTIMGIFSAVINGRFCDGTHGHQLLGFAAMGAIYLAVIGSFGLLLFSGVPFVNMVGVLPFLVVSIGIDDVFIILHEFNEVIRGTLPSSYVISSTMAKAGPTITMTTLTDLVAFAVSCHSIFPAVRYFCAYAATSIAFAFLLIVTFFVACMWFDVKRIRRKRHGCLPCVPNTPALPCCPTISRYGLDKVMEWWGKQIMTRRGKVLVLATSMLLMTCGIYGAFNIDDSFQRQLLTTRDSHYRRYLDVFEEYFHLEIDVNVIIPGNLNFTDKAVQQRYLALADIASENVHYKSKVKSWLPEYLEWEERQGDWIRSWSFFEKFERFVTIRQNRRFFFDINFAADKKTIIASKVTFFSESNPASHFQKEMMTTIRKDLAEKSDLGAFVVLQYFVYFEQYAHVVGETIRNLIIAGFSILFISSFFLNHPAVILCLLFGFVEIILELFGFMYIWGVSINSISMVNLVMALGFSVDYNAHVAYHFVAAKSSSVDQRVIDALKGVGGSVFLGGLSTFLGMLPTSFASSLVFQIFFKMFFGIVLLGLFHGLVVLPVHLSLLGRIFDFRKITTKTAFAKWLLAEKDLTEDRRGMAVSKVGKIHSPVSVVGMSCRFAGGVESKEDFWAMLVEGKCGINSYPKDRPTTKLFEDFYNPGRNTPGKHYVLKGAFMDKILGFDAQFFGISTTESKSIDPQQRLLLHVVYEAIEDAGLRLEDLQECRTGVYVGLMNLDYGNLVLNPKNIRKVDQFASTGTTYSVTANRISFLLNLNGPSLTVDTACSSSLTALHLAFGHLQNGETDFAIVCAPNILLNGRAFHLACARAGMLAEDGCCKSFDIKGDGYGRGEGVAAVVLTLSSRLNDTQNDSYAEIIASGVNNDGQSSIPMTSPSESAQRILFKKVFQESGVPKDDITYVEAHGTGTAIGDVVEMGSISAVYGNSDNRVLRVGSVKSNINHTESAAGLAGLIKTCLMIKRAQLVPTINVHREKPDLRIPERKMMVQVDLEPWETTPGKLRTAAISCYGYGGSNAHLIVREMRQAPPFRVHKLKPRHNRVMTLTARSAGALKDMAMKTSQYLQILGDEDDELLKDNICYSLNERYTAHAHRLAVTFASFQQASQALDMFCGQEEGWRDLVTVSDTSSTSRTNIVFLYGGQGTRWYGMATEMMKYEPVFKKSIKKIDKVLKKIGVPWLLVKELNRDENESRIEENPIGQMALFGVHYALTQLLKAWGISPAAVLGHSLGEISAACTAGCLKLEQAVRIVLLRSKLQESCSTTGAMAAVGMSVKDTEKMLDHLNLAEVIDIAVINSPKDVVLSGDQASIKLIGHHLDTKHGGNVFWRELSTTRAFHSREMENIKDEFLACAKSMNLKSVHEKIPFFSSVKGAQVSGNEMNRDHWWENIRDKVQFSSALDALFTEGHRTFLEINAGPQLARHVLTAWTAYHGNRVNEGNDVVVIQTLPKRGVDEQHRAFLQNCAAHMFTSGLPVKWGKIQGCGSKSFMRRPNYPWQETDYWYTDQEPGAVGFLGDSNPDEVEMHPLLGASLPVRPFCGLYAWENETELYRLPYLKDHKFSTSPDPVVPAAVYVEMVFAMVKQMAPDSCPDVREMSFDNLITISDEDSYRFRLRLFNTQMDQSSAEFQITKVEDVDEREILLSKGRVSIDPFGQQEIIESEPNGCENFETLKSSMECQPSDYMTTKRNEVKMDFGTQFDLIKTVWTGKYEAFAEVVPTEEILRDASSYIVHPCIIDACFQCCLFLQTSSGQPVPYKVHKTLLQRRKLTPTMYCHVKATRTDNDIRCNITLYDCYGQVVILMKEFTLVDISSLTAPISYHNTAFTEEWQVEEQPPVDDDHETIDTLWVILQDDMGLSESFVEYLPRKNTVVTIGAASDISSMVRKTLQAHCEDSNVKNRPRLVLVNFLPVDAGRLRADYHDFDAAHHASFESSLLITKAMMEEQQSYNDMRLVLVTTGAVPLTTLGEPVFPWSATCIGFRRTLARETPQISCTLMDLSQQPSVIDYQQMVADLDKLSIDEEIVYRHGTRYINMLTRLKSNEVKHSEESRLIDGNGRRKPIEIAFADHAIYLRENVKKSGVDDALLLVDYACPVCDGTSAVLDPQQRVAFSATTYHDQETRMVGICAAGQLASFITATDCCLSNALDELATQQAASLCWPMVTSYYIINDVLAGKATNRTILVYHDHVQTVCVFAAVALSAGATPVCMVANNHDARKITSLGDNIRAFSEDDVVMGDDFADISLDVVVLLSRPHKNVFPSLTTELKSHGTLVIVPDGKKACIEMPDCQKDVEVITRNIGDAVTRNSEIFSSLLADCKSLLVSSGNFDTLLQLPQQATSIYNYVSGQDDTPNVSQTRSEDVTFNTLSFRPDVIPEQVQFYNLPFDKQGVRRNCSFLVVGGMRGFGFEVVKWLVENGAAVVMCTALSPPSAEKLDEVRALEEQWGCRILLRQADVTSWEEMCGVVDELQNVAQISGIVFSAMFLKDQMIADADLETCKKVVATKVMGAVVLHELSLNMKLDFFIVFSSVTGVLGNIGQLSYASANTFLDSLCRYRRHTLALPALSVNWGPINGAGVLERFKDVATSLQKQGFDVLPYGTALAFLKQFMLSNAEDPQVCLSNINWPQFFKGLSNISKRFKELQAEFASVLLLQTRMTLRDLAMLPLSDRIAYIEGFVKALLSSWSGTGQNEVDLKAGLYKFGIDSIGAANMAMQLYDGLGAKFENFFFIQPKTNGISIINEVLRQVDNLDKQDDDGESNTNEQAAVKSIEDGVKSEEEDGVESRQDQLNLPEDGVKLPEDGVNLPEDGVKLPEDGFKIPEDDTKSPIGEIDTVKNDERYGKENLGADKVEEKPNRDMEMAILRGKRDQRVMLGWDQEGSNDAKVVPLYTPDEALVKLFVVHSGIKDALTYVAFAPSFQRQTLVALYCIGYTGGLRSTTDGYGSVNTLAHKYIELMKEKQPKGPYYLGGYSFGGMVVYEMASLLSEKDEEVHMVFMLDTFNWVPVSSPENREIMLAKIDRFHYVTVDLLLADLVKRTACQQLDMSLKEFEELKGQCADDDIERLVIMVEEKAAKDEIKISLREEIAVVQHELRGALSAQYDWQPLQIRYKGLLTYARCESNARIKMFWDTANNWRSLTNNMNQLFIPGDHYVNRDEYRVRLCGSLLMTTAAFAFLAKHPLSSLARLRSQSDENKVDWLKKGVAIAICSKQVCTKDVKGKLRLSRDEKCFTFNSDATEKGKSVKIRVKHLHNILPALFVDDEVMRKRQARDLDLMICLLAEQPRLTYFKCSDLGNLDDVIDAMEALFKTPLVRLHGSS